MPLCKKHLFVPQFYCYTASLKFSPYSGFILYVGLEKCIPLNKCLKKKKERQLTLSHKLSYSYKSSIGVLAGISKIGLINPSLSPYIHPCNSGFLLYFHAR